MAESTLTDQPWPTVTGTVSSDRTRRFQLLGYREVTRLSDVMEAVVPIHGTGNFPTLDIKPSVFVQLVRQRLSDIGICVRDIRLNGSAATHVLSDDTEPNYKDLDLIFAIDLPGYDAEPIGADCAKKPKSKTVDDNRRRKRFDSSLPRLRPTSLPTSPRHRGASPKAEDLTAVEDSGYTSSGSSVSSAPESPLSTTCLEQSLRERSLRLRTRSVESTSSIASSRRDVSPGPWNRHQNLLRQHHRDECWQKIKDAVIEILLEFMPEGVCRTRMNSVVLSAAYVQKMVKVTNDWDRWSLISLNNNTGRNLELKFVQSMRRQFEFSVDSFQIVLDTYLQFRDVVRKNESEISVCERFHPTVIAESVYGDFPAALRHLKYRRICTHRPEEIRGGGLLRYCNLLVRDYVPGDCDDKGRNKFSPKDPSSSHPFAVARLEQHMCSRFFIDFSDIELQQRKLITYLDSHFNGEDDLKFQYLLRLREVVSTSTVCLMQHERTLILDLITGLVRQTLAQNVARADSTFQMNHAPAMPGYYYPHGNSGVQFSYDASQSYATHIGPSCPYPPPPLSDRSSPMSTYSSVAPSTHGDTCSSCASPAPQSRPLTPAGPQPMPQPPPPASGDYHYPVYQPHRCYHCGCCCCCSHSGTHDHLSPYPHRYDMYPPPTTPPIYFSPSTMTCFYQPAPYARPRA